LPIDPTTKHPNFRRVATLMLLLKSQLTVIDFAWIQAVLIVENGG
jgi:hypothetical protein